MMGFSNWRPVGAAAHRLSMLLDAEDVDPSQQRGFRGLVAELKDLGVRTVMVTGDAQATAEVVAGTVGIDGKVWATTLLPQDLRADEFAIFAGVLPEDKYRLVKALQKTGHLVECAAMARTMRQRCGRHKWVSLVHRQCEAISEAKQAAHSQPDDCRDHHGHG